MRTAFKATTYEIYYKNEIIRIIIIFILFFANLISVYYWKSKPTFVLIIYAIVLGYLLAMIHWSLARFSEIKTNKAKSILLTNSEFYKVQEKYQKSKIVIYAGGKYLTIKPYSNLKYESIYLLRIDGKYPVKSDIKIIIS